MMFYFIRSIFLQIDFMMFILLHTFIHLYVMHYRECMVLIICIYKNTTKDNSCLLSICALNVSTNHVLKRFDIISHDFINILYILLKYYWNSISTMSFLGIPNPVPKNCSRYDIINNVKHWVIINLKEAWCG